MAALTGLLGDYGSDDESAASGQEVTGPPTHFSYTLLCFLEQLHPSHSYVDGVLQALLMH